MTTRGDLQERILKLERAMGDLIEAIEDPFLPKDDLEEAVNDATYCLYHEALEEEL